MSYLFGERSLAMRPYSLNAFMRHVVSQLDAAGGIAKLSERRPVASVNGLGEPDDPGFDLVDGIAVIPIRGVIMQAPPWWLEYFGVATCNAIELRLAVERANNSPAVKAVFFPIDSGGGEIAREAVNAIRRLTKPSAAHIESMGASMAYWLGAACGTLTASSTALAGSIGVYTTIDDTSELYRKAGVHVHLVASGEVKGQGASGVPLAEPALGELSDIVGELADMFFTDIKSFRPQIEIDSVRSGRVWVAKSAQGLGLIDGVMDKTEAFEALKESIGMATPLKANKASKIKSEETKEPVEPATSEAMEEDDIETEDTEDGAEEEKLEALRRENKALRAQLSAQETADKNALLEAATRDGRLLPAGLADARDFAAKTNLAGLKRFLGALPTRLHTAPLGSSNTEQVDQGSGEDEYAFKQLFPQGDLARAKRRASIVAVDGSFAVSNTGKRVALKAI